MPEKKEKADAPGFDEHLASLEGIVNELEEGGLGLKSAIDRYQQGIEHLKSCHKTLAKYQQRVEELTRGAEEALRPYEADPDFPAKAADREARSG